MSFTRRDFLAGSAVAVVAGALGRPAIARAWQAQTPAPPAAPVFTPLRRNVGTFTLRGAMMSWLGTGAGVKPATRPGVCGAVPMSGIGPLITV